MASKKMRKTKNTRNNQMFAEIMNTIHAMIPLPTATNVNTKSPKFFRNGTIKTPPNTASMTNMKDNRMPMTAGPCWYRSPTTSAMLEVNTVKTALIVNT